MEKKDFDTNKLPPLPKAAELTTSLRTGELEKASAASPTVEHVKIAGVEFAASEMIETPKPAEVLEVEVDEIDDLARYLCDSAAGVFDLIIGGVITAVLMTPFLLSDGAWMTVSGMLAFSAALFIVMFVYLTAGVGFFGRTVGMKLFSLELLDADENAYPTLHQAAVNSSVYLLSLFLFGVGLLPIFFNEEKRAAHDLVAGTILIRDFS